ncbi:hypothetical protein HIMB11_02589 [Rhodobacteraceae bacterium HIMB11]|nr:hypothetical protein HIMB11_02589 [Rhodobacteraceae bacterium HIMB11]
MIILQITHELSKPEFSIEFYKIPLTDKIK